MNRAALTIENVGPVEALAIPIGDDGGITVLRGANDSGKSLALEACQRLLGGKQKVEQRDGSATAGEVCYGDVLLRVGKTTRQSGELEVLSIEGTLAIQDLVDPPVKSPEVADRTRTKALCRLTGVEADEALFYEVFGGREQMAAVISPATIETDDVVELQRRIKADADTEAKRLEDAATKAEGEAKACKAAFEGIDLEAECDQETLQTAVEETLRTAERFSGERKHANEQKQRAVDAQEAIKEARLHYDGLSEDEAKLKANEAGLILDAAEQTMQEARLACERAQINFDVEAGLYRLAREYEKAMAAWQETISVDVTNPSNEEIEAADAGYRDACIANRAGVKVREAKEKQAAHDEARQAMNRYRAAAINMRLAGRDTEKVLAEVVEADGLQLRAERWITQHPERGEVFFADRSKGTRASMAMQLVINRVRSLGGGQAMVPFPQELWEGMDHANRQKLFETCQRLDVRVITAEADREEADSGDLRAEEYGE